MLDIFRQRGISNVIYGAIIVATIFAFVVTFRPNATSKTASLNETCVARVRGRCIDPKDFSAAYRIIMPSKSQALSRKLNLKRVALDGLVERELLDDEAKTAARTAAVINMSVKLPTSRLERCLVFIALVSPPQRLR